MQNVPKDLVEVGASFEQDYSRPALDFHGWKVAMLRSCNTAATWSTRRNSTG